MTDREVLRNIVDIFSKTWGETDLSITIPGTRTRIIFTEAGEIKSIIRQGLRYGPEDRAS